MDTKLLARIGAGAFVAVALTMTVIGLRDRPEAASAETVTVWEPDGDPLPATLRACAAMGELALSTPDCRAAWTEKRRRFLGRNANAAVSMPAEQSSDDAAAADQPPAKKAN